MLQGIKHGIKKLMFSAAPRWSTSFFSARARAQSHRVVDAWGCTQITRKLIETYGTNVQQGPFVETVLAPMAQKEHLGPYLLGTYECELNAAWQEILSGTFDQVIDIGAKFGYYAVGLARRFPQAEVTAFDTDPWARAATAEMVKANGVKVDVREFCDANWLRKNVRGRAFIISDCEGYERELFGKGDVSYLRSTALIIETHDDLAPGCTTKVRANLSATHHITAIESNSACHTSNLDLSFLSEKERNMALNEVRPPQIWLYCKPK